MTLREWVQQAERQLTAIGVESSALEAQLLAAHALGVPRVWLIAHGDEPAPLLPLDHLLQRRLDREPLAYILGHREFYGRPFRVTRQVLIPRQETETLVDAALALPGEIAEVLDLGTGSGCLAVTLALARRWRVTAVDVSPSALDLARQNAELHGAEIEFVLSDGFAALEGRRFDLIVSNPPYVEEAAELAPEVRRYEPALALFSGPTGFEFYDRLLDEAPRHLGPGGAMVLEMGDGQADEVAKRARAQGWVESDRVLDLLGHPRALCLMRDPS